MLPVLKYTVMRLALFVGVLALLAYLGANLLLALIAAGLVSMMLSYVLLRGPRTQVAELIAARVAQRHLGESGPHRKPMGLDDDAEAEDAADDRDRDRAPDPADRDA